MVESKLVELVVAGSNPVGHPIFPIAVPKISLPLSLARRCQLQNGLWFSFVVISFGMTRAIGLDEIIFHS
jgi:hypothetical protein